MSKGVTKTNNDLSLIKLKIQLRIDSISHLKDDVKVLDLFGGEGVLWNEVRKVTGKNIDVLGIDKIKYKNVQLQGDNLKFIDSIDLNSFDVIDVDAWESPFNQVEQIFKKNFKGVVHCTFIQTMMGGLNKNMLLKLGYTENMIKKIKSVFSKNGIEKFKNYLALNNIEKIFILSKNNKNYLYFYLDK